MAVPGRRNLNLTDGDTVAVADCTYPVLGRFKAIALVLADECGAPIVGSDKGWVDQCPGAFAYTEDVEEADDFARECADGTNLLTLPGKVTLKGYDVELDLHTADPGFWGAVAGATPVMQGPTVVGWDQCKSSSGSASLYLWREIVQAGGAACGTATDQQYLVTIFPWVDQIRVQEQGTFGAADGYLRLSGSARTGHKFDKGALPLFPATTDPETNPPVCMTQTLSADCAVRHVVTTVPWPDDCGFFDVTACA